jgi:LysM domain
MSVMRAAEAGQTPGTGQEILPRGPRTATSATDQDAVGPDASSQDERSAQADPSPPGRPDRRLRLITTQVRVTEVRVARDVSARPPRAGSPRESAQRVSAQRVSAERTSVQRASAQRASAQRVTAPGASVRRVSVRRASAQRVRMQGASGQPGGLRLTRRGRRVLTGFVMLVIVVSAMLIWTSVAGGAQAPSPGAPPKSAYQGLTQIVVQPGQTLWSIAASAEPSANPWEAVQQIIDINALDGAHVQAGQLLWVPGS